MAPPSPAENAYQKSHINDDKRAEVIAPNIIFLAIAYVAVLARLIARRLAGTILKADDWWIVAGLVLTTSYVIGYSLTIKYGMGRHAILLTDVKNFSKTAIAAETAYNVSIIAIKISILYLYRRIFPQQWFKYVLISVGVFVLAYSIAQVFGDIFQCVPIDSLWDPNVPGKCIQYGTLVLTMGIVNIATDFIILSLPIPLLWKLQVSKARKRVLITTFLLGGIVCIISIVRLFYAKQVGSTDPSYDDVDGATLSAIECCCGIVSACAPTFRPLFNYWRYGSARRDYTQDTSKAYGSKASELKHLKALGRDRSRIEPLDSATSAGADGPYTRLGTTTNITRERENKYQPRPERGDIVITRGFTSTSAED